jgi:hypothetical protein
VERIIMKTLFFIIVTLMLIVSAPVTGAISAQSPQALARDMDDVQSLGVIYINRHSASEEPEAQEPPEAPISVVSPAETL